MSADTPRRLGRGLEALLSTAKQQRENAQPESASASGTGSDFRTIRIADITPNHFQPRRTFTEVELAELESSIRTNGLLQPVTVRAAGNRWELVAGERRLRAATRLGWTEIPVLIRDFDDRAMLTLALVENLQRTDLNAIEEAEGYQRLIAEFQLTQQQVAEAVGKDRTTITNLIRLLALPGEVKSMLESGKLSTGHARALLAIRDAKRQIGAAHETVARQWSVRDLEQHARVGTSKNTSTSRQTNVSRVSKAEPNPDPSLRRIEEQLRRKLQTDVSVQQTATDRGAVRIAFYGADDLERLLDLLLGQRSDFD